ncbi:hypothetical protein ACWCYZ_41195 [Streptomyces virginiae]
MQNTADEERAAIRLQPVEELLPAGVPVCELSWDAALNALNDAARSCLPHLLPTGSGARVVTWPKGSTFGSLLDACRVFAENGGQERAERVAHEARTLKLLTTVPRLRHYREAAPPPGSSAADVFTHERIGSVGNGFLAVTLAELTTAGQQHRQRGIFSIHRARRP